MMVLRVARARDMAPDLASVVVVGMTLLGVCATVPKERWDEMCLEGKGILIKLGYECMLNELLGYGNSCGWVLGGNVTGFLFAEI